MRSPAVNVALAAAVLVALAVPQVGVTPAVALPVTTLGETSLLSNSPAPYTSVQNVPTFQGAAGGNYTLSTSVAGTITSWSFLSAGVAAGKHFALRVLRPQTDGSWLAVATSSGVVVTSATGSDAVNGPFSVAIPIAAGDRIGLQPTDDNMTPLEQGSNGSDGIRYFDAPFADGAVGPLSASSAADNGQVVPIQATVDTSGTPPPPPQPLANAAPPTISGSPLAGGPLTCSPGLWTSPSATFSYAWKVNETFSLPQALPVLWKRTAQAPPRSLAKSRFASKRGTASSLRLAWRRPAYSPILAEFSTGPTVTVPDFVAHDRTLLPGGGFPTAITCEVTATDGAMTVVAESASVTLLPARPAVQSALVAGHLRNGRPNIGTNVGVGGTNHCSQGSWAHHPTSYSFVWYTLGRPTRTTLSPRTKVAVGRRWKLPPFVEGKQLECVVTARNGAGSTEAASVSYRVPVTGPVSLDGAWIVADTSTPTGGGLVAPGDTGASLIAQRVHLSCNPGHWNRSDLTFQYWWWFNSDKSYWTSGYSVPGKDITFDAPPSAVLSRENSANPSAGVLNQGGRLGDGDFGPFEAQCFVAARTSHGRSTGVSADGSGGLDATSAIVNVWNGCSAEADINSGSTIWLWPGTTIVLSGERVDTLGPNCGAYQKAYEAEGYDVHQVG